MMLISKLLKVKRSLPKDILVRIVEEQSKNSIGVTHVISVQLKLGKRSDLQNYQRNRLQSYSVAEKQIIWNF